MPMPHALKPPTVTGMAGSRNQPGPGTLGSEVHRAQWNDLAVNLFQLALDLAGIEDTTPISDGASATIALARGQWLDDLMHGLSVFPYIGDLAKSGKLPKYLRSVEKSVELAAQSREFAIRLLPGMERLQKALAVLPRGVDPSIDRILDLVRDYLSRHHSPRLLTTEKLDVSSGFRTITRVDGDRRFLETTGRLGVPSKVQQYRSRFAQRQISAGTGDDAGHRAGSQFGAPGGIANLARQNSIQNQGGGTWFRMEGVWAEQLEHGVGIEIKVTDAFRQNEARPYKRNVEWTEIHPDGRRITRTEIENATFVNFETPKSRQAAGYEPPKDAPNAKVLTDPRLAKPNASEDEESEGDDESE